MQKHNQLKLNEVSSFNFLQWTESHFINILCKNIFCCREITLCINAFILQQYRIHLSYNI
jgi:hypothetical protein